jgi:hypothetical protein
MRPPRSSDARRWRYADRWKAPALWRLPMWQPQPAGPLHGNSADRMRPTMIEVRLFR